MKPRSWEWLSYAQAGLPVLGAGLLAGFTWWLVQSSPQPESARRTAVAPTVPDYTLERARISRLDTEGRLKAVIDGEVIRHYPEGDRIEIDVLELSARGDEGDSVHALSHRGEAFGTTEVITLTGAVRVTAMPVPGTAKRQGMASTAPVRLVGEGLKMDGRTRVLSADQPTTLYQAGSVVRGNTMRHDERTGVTEFKGRVTGRYELASRP